MQNQLPYLGLRRKKEKKFKREKQKGARFGSRWLAHQPHPRASPRFTRESVPHTLPPPFCVRPRRMWAPSRALRPAARRVLAPRGARLIRSSAAVRADGETSLFLGAQSNYTIDPSFYYPKKDTLPALMPCFRLMDDEGVAVPGATLPEIDKETCVKMITTMVSVNEFDKVYNDAQRQGRLSFYFTNRGMPRRARTPDWQTPGRPATHTLEPRRGQVRRRWRWARRRRSSSPTGSGRSTASWARASGAASRTRTRPTSAVAAQRRRESDGRPAAATAHCPGLLVLALRAAAT